MSDQYVEVCYSKDGGYNWSNWKRKDIGEVGQYERRIRFNRFGAARQIVFKIRVSSPRVSDLLGGVAMYEGTDG